MSTLLQRLPKRPARPRSLSRRSSPAGPSVREVCLLGLRGPYVGPGQNLTHEGRPYLVTAVQPRPGDVADCYVHLGIQGSADR